MNLNSLLNQALNSDLVKKGKEQLQNSSTTTSKTHLPSLGAGALGGGLVGLLMGSKKSRKIGKKVGKNALKIGGAAALGALAYKVYNDWQSAQGNTESNQNYIPSSSHEEKILRAMIAAAKADGHVDEAEMIHIESAIEQAGAELSLQQLVHSELNKPLNPEEIARLASTLQEGSEIYLASLLVIDQKNSMETLYLKALAEQLRLAPEVVHQLELQVSDD
ncbi:tellurite resistance TerB family protein [Vibrio sonorensis]|uniref:tellurite resistance TerB family protein n=1 Tax=Vibrio sonorensis TaxID=1004316 RepID=UPI0008D9FEC0|nr:tellurite resistance TerB family protein [Vibrio sonorensis]